jgi:hypothetical protein
VIGGVHRERQVLHFSRETFPRWFAKRTRPARPSTKKVALFSTCLVNYQVMCRCWKKTASRWSFQNSVAAGCPGSTPGT